MERMMGSILNQAVVAGIVASLIIDSTRFGAGCVIGGTYAAVAHLTKPFFEEQGMRDSLLPFFTNTIVTTSLVNWLGLSLRVSSVVCVVLLEKSFL